MMDYDFGEPDIDYHEREECVDPYEPTVLEIQRNGDRDFYHEHTVYPFNYEKRMRYRHSSGGANVRYVRVSFIFCQYQWYYTQLIPGMETVFESHELNKDEVIDLICLGSKKWEEKCAGWEFINKGEEFKW